VNRHGKDSDKPHSGRPISKARFEKRLQNSKEEGCVLKDMGKSPLLNQV